MTTNTESSKGLSKARAVIWLAVNAYIVISVALIVRADLAAAHSISQVDDASKSAGYFSAFTVDTAVFMAAVALIGLILAAVSLKKRGSIVLPKGYTYLYLSAAASLTLVFLVVACFLSPIKVMNGYSYFKLFSHHNFFNHFLTPLLSAVTLDAVWKTDRLSVKKAWTGAIPMLLYTVVYIIEVVVLQNWPDLYNFTFGGRYYLLPLVFVVVFGITFGLSAIHVKLHNRGIN